MVTDTGKGSSELVINFHFMHKTNLWMNLNFCVGMNLEMDSKVNLEI